MSVKISDLATRLTILSDDLLVIANDSEGLNFKITIAELQTALGDITLATYQKELDEISATEYYLGESLPGTATSSPNWRIQKILITSGDISIKYADTGNFSQVWDNRLVLSYS